MKLNNGGYDKETTLEFFNSHIIPIDLLQNLTDLEGVWELEWCGKFKSEEYTIEHVDTYLKEDKSSWRVQLHIVYRGDTILDEWNDIVRVIQKYGLNYSGKNGERIWVELTDSTIKVIITYTFSIPYVESVPEFNTPEEREEWAKSILEKFKK